MYYVGWIRAFLKPGVLCAGAKVNSVKFHETALHHAARGDVPDLIELLVAFGGDVFASDNLGRKPIDYATSGSPAHTCLTFYEGKFKLHCTPVHSTLLHCTVFIFIALPHEPFSFPPGSDHPLSLQHLCRISVRTALGTKASKVIGQLDISPRIRSYLRYCDWLSHITGVSDSAMNSMYLYFII